MLKRLVSIGVILALILSSMTIAITWADGSETLGPPSIAIETGTGIATGGTGLFGGNGVLASGTINVSVPAGATVNQVLLYWEGARNASATPPPSTTLLVNGQPATGSVIGGPTLIPLIPPPDAELITYRADITSLGVVSPGANSLTISGSPFVNRTNAGAGVVVIFDDGSGASTIDIRDGNDFAIAGGTPTLDAVVPQTFTFPASTTARTADISMFIADVQPNRSYTIEITTGGVTSEFPNVVGAVQIYKVGEFWDVADLSVNIPAGETSLTATIVSESVGGNQPASFIWVTGGFSVENPDPQIDIEKLTNGNQADGANDADVPQIAPGDPVTWTYQVTNTGNVAFDVSEVTVTDDIIGAITNIVDMDDGDNTLSPGEVWLYEASVPGAEDLQNPSAGVVVVQGCNPSGDPVPGERETYENIGTVTVPGDSDEDPSHYCNPPDPQIDIEKLTNGNQADGANDADVPVLNPGDMVTFTYIVTNTGNVDIAQADVDVSDSVIDDAGIILVDDGNSDGVLSPGEVWTYEATDTVEDLDNTSLPSSAIVQGCNPSGDPVPGERETYENIGTVSIPGDTDSDPSHHCNPPSNPGIDIEKFTKIVEIVSSGDLCDTFGKPQILTMLYTGDNVLDHTQDSGKVNVSGDPMFEAVVQIIASENDDGSGKIYFDGVVNLGEEFTIDANLPGDDELKSKTFVLIFDQSDNLLQNIEFHTSCSQPLELGNQFGGIQLVGFEDKDGDGDVFDPDLTDIGDDADTPTGPEGVVGDTVRWTYLVTNTGDVALADVVVVDDNGTIGDTSDDFSPTFVEGDDNNNGLLDLTETWVYEATGTVSEGQYRNDSKVTGEDPDTGEMVMDDDPSHHFGNDVPAECQSGFKINSLTLELTEVPAGAVGPFTITASNDGVLLATFTGVAVGDEFGPVTPAGGATLFDKNDVVFTIVDETTGDTLTDDLKVHTSCSDDPVAGETMDESDGVKTTLVDFEVVDKDAPPAITVEAGEVVAGAVEFDDKKVNIELTNTGDGFALIDVLQLTWPSENKKLKKVKVDGDEVFDDDRNAPSTTINPGDWKGKADKRLIGPGETVELRLEFEKDANTDISAYDLDIDFGAGLEAVLN